MITHNVDIRNALQDAVQPKHMAGLHLATGQRVLILDDEVDVAQTIAMQVAVLGHQVRAVSDHTAFLEAMRSFQPDILIIDTCMPGQDALDIIRGLDRAYPVKIIVTSGYGRRMLETVLHSARHYGHEVLGGLPKPIRRGALEGLLARKEADAAPPKTDRIASRAAFVPAEADLRAALANDEFCAYFQPKLCLKTRSICAFEALVRWIHPQYGLLPPAAFLPKTLECGLETELTFMMMEKACAFLSGLPDPAVRIAVNASLATAQLPEFRARLDATVQRHKLIPGRLIIEVTESGDAELPQCAIETLTRLRMAGYHLSIDDFGTGVSGLTRLVRVPFSELKIDRSFVLGLTQSEEAQDIVASLVRLGRTLEMSVSVEGIEDEATLALIEALGCDVAQGYHIGHPMPAYAAERMFTGSANGRRPLLN